MFDFRVNINDVEFTAYIYTKYIWVKKHNGTFSFREDLIDGIRIGIKNSSLEQDLEKDITLYKKVLEKARKIRSLL